MITSVSKENQDIIEARAALRLCAELSVGARGLPHDIAERLRISRMQAVDCIQTQLVQSRPVVAVSQKQHNLALAGANSSPMHLPGLGGSKWGALSYIIPFLLLISGFLIIHYFDESEQINAMAEVDAALLADDLPPEAYTDPGFGEFLDSAKILP